MQVTHCLCDEKQFFEVSYNADCSSINKVNQVLLDIHFHARMKNQGLIPANCPKKGLPEHVKNQWTFPPAIQPPLKLPGWDSTRFLFNMGKFWTQGFLWTFMDIFERYHHVWSLTPTPSLVCGKDWNKLIFTGKVRFICECGRGWTSMQGKVIFWYKKLPDQPKGTVLFRRFGQKCKACPLRTSPADPVWYYEEVTAALQELRQSVGTGFYNEFPSPFLNNFGSASVFRRSILKPVRRTGIMKDQHDSSRCEACQLNVCR